MAIYNHCVIDIRSGRILDRTLDPTAPEDAPLILLKGGGTSPPPAVEDVPPPPVEPVPDPTEAARREEEERVREAILVKRRGRQSTILTGGLGDTSEAPVQRKTLLGQ